MSGGGNGGVGGTNGAVTAQPVLAVQPSPVESPFGGTLGGRPVVQPTQRDPYGYGSQVQPRPYSPPQLTMTYEEAQIRTMQRDVKSPAEQAAIDAALAVPTGAPPAPYTGPQTLATAVGSASAVQQPCPQQPYGVMKPANPFQPQNFEQRLSALEEWQKTRV